MYISVIDFQRYCTRRNGFQLLNHSSLDYYYMHHLWNYIYYISSKMYWYCSTLTHWGRATHICVDKLTIIGSDNGLSPGRRQSIIWTIAGILLVRTLGTNVSEILGKIHSFSFSKMHLKMLSAKWRLFGLGLNELNQYNLCYKFISHLNTDYSGLEWNNINAFWYWCGKYIFIYIADAGNND